MKYIAVIMLVFAAVSLFGITIIDAGRELALGSAEIVLLPRTEIETTRRRPGDFKTDKWQGVLLHDVLESFDINHFDRIVFSSDDNYQVRLSAPEMAAVSVLIALQQNETEFTEGNYRLIVPGKRSMFWIGQLSRIRTEFYNEMPPPDVVFFAEDLLAAMRQLNDSEEYEEIAAYDFMGLISMIYPFLQGEFLFVARDGFTQRLDVDTYLYEAVLVSEKDGYHLKGSHIPAGMSVKKLSYIQFLDRAVIFRERFTSFQEVQELLGWEACPEFLYNQDDFMISTEDDFNNTVWEHSGRLRWEK